MKVNKKYGLVSLEEYEPQLMTCLNCYCGLCIESCASYRELGNEVVATRGLAQVGLGILRSEVNLPELSDEIVYACTGCRWCEWNCSLNTPSLIQREGTRRTKVSGATVAEIFRSMKAESGNIPPVVRDALSNIVKFGNPYGRSPKIKDKWVGDLGLSVSESHVDTILYVGSTIPFENRATKMAEAFIEILRLAKQDFRMLGSEEKCSGAFPLMLGEEGLFVEMVEHNLNVFKKYGVKRIICVSPHDYDVFVNLYENIDEIEVMHYTKILSELIDCGKISLKKELKKTVTYQDPCYLGRKNNSYDDSRKILKSIPGLRFIEMDKTKQNALCCGGGGTGLFLDLPSIKINLSRADHIKAKSVDCVAVACPNCLQMLDDGLKSRNYEIEVKDVSQLITDVI